MALRTCVLDLPARRAIWSRYWGARHALKESVQTFEEFPNRITAAQFRWAESELEDAVAVAGEFEVPNVPWNLS
jgi:hypothetical protein